jgi:PAS domain S-box-containing protein
LKKSENEPEQIEEKLRQSEERYRMLFETMAHGVVYQDADGKIISANPAAQRILGLTLDQIRGRISMDPGWKAIHEDGSDFPGETHPAMIALKTGKEVKNVIMGVFNPGEEKHRWINVHAVPQFRQGEDRPYQVYTTFEDISEYKRVSDNIKESEKKYKDLVELNTDIIFRSDREGNIVFMNNSGFNIIEYTPDEIMHQSFLKCIHPDDNEKVSKKFKYMMENGIDVFDFENRIISKSGKVIDFLVNVRVLRNSNDEIIGTQGIGKDITRRKQIEKALQESHDIIDAVSTVQSLYINDSHPQILFDNLMNSILTLTKSKFGFIGEVLYKNKNEPYLKTRTITDIAWNNEIKESYHKDATDAFELYNLKTLFGHVISTGKPVIANNPSEDNKRGDIPQDHTPIKCFLGLPFYHRKKLVGVVGIANRPGGYDDKLVEYLQPLLNKCGNIIEAYRNIQQRKLAEEELLLRANLAELGKEIGVYLSHGDSLQNILQQCTTSLVKNLDAALARIWTFDQRDKVLELQASAGMYTHINGGHSRIPLGMFKIGRMAKYRKPHMTNKIIGDPEVHDQEWALREKLVSFAGYPLIVDKRLVGVMALFSRQPLRDFSFKALSSVADNIANGIDRKKSEEKLQRSEEKYRDLFENANDSICILDSNLKFKEVNKKTVEMLDYSKEELFGMSAFDIIPPEHIPDFKIEFNKLRKMGSYEKFIGKARRKDGVLIDVEVSSSAIKEGDKNIGSRDIIRDITERMLIQDALREREEHYRNIIEYSNDMIWILDIEGNLQFFNKRSEEISGHRLEDWQGKSFAPLIIEEDLPKVIKVFYKTLRGQAQQYEVSVKKKDGTILILSVNTAPIYSKGKVTGTVSFGRDITERKRVEDVIMESEIRLQSILDNSSTVVFLKDLQGRYITINRRYEELFHVSRNEVVDKTDYDIFPREYADKFRQHDRQAVEKGRAIEIEEVVPHEDSIHTYISVKFPLLTSDGKPYAVCGIATDITERKRTEKQIEEALREKEVLLREVYHRVKNNMQIISSLMKLQSRYVKEEQYREIFKESQNRIKSMSLVHERLYQSKDLSQIDFKEYIKDIARGLFQSYGASKGNISLIMDINNISFNINSAIPCGLIINELITNSLKHAFSDGREGEIKIAIHSANGNSIELVVGDNGVGIPENIDFKRTKSLGLHLVTMLAENQLHGEINLDRSKGTEFRIKFKE